jgi:hypothetical protein
MLVFESSLCREETIRIMHLFTIVVTVELLLYTGHSSRQVIPYVACNDKRKSTLRSLRSIYGNSGKTEKWLITDWLPMHT